MSVPLLDVKRQNQPLAAGLEDAFRRVLTSGQYILGREVEIFEVEAAAVAGARYAVGVSSGTDAILATLMALEVGPGDEVIAPSFTFFATAGCVARTGAKPVFADSCPVCFNLDPDRLEQWITPRTKAIIPVHLFGQPADMPPILEVARRHGLAVIEDAAQSFGASPVVGDCQTISFFPSKNLGGMGDGGLVATNDASLAEKLRLLRNHGMHPKYFHSMAGGNFRIDALHAALLLVKLPHLAAYSRARAENGEAYNRELSGVPGAVLPRAGGRCPGVDAGGARLVLPAAHVGRAHIRNQYTIRVPGRRDELRRVLAERGIASEIYYPVPLHRQECFQKYGPYPALPVCERLAGECLSIPVFAELTAGERAEVVAAIREFVEE